MKQSVKDGIDEVARDVIEQRGSRHPAGLPLHVWAQVQERRPDICGHLRRYTRGRQAGLPPGALEDEAE